MTFVLGSISNVLAVIDVQWIVVRICITYCDSSGLNVRNLSTIEVYQN